MCRAPWRTSSGKCAGRVNVTHGDRVPSREDLQIEFRQIQKPRMLELSAAQWLHLF